MTSTSLADGRATVPGELDVTWRRPGWGHQSATAVVYCHGYGDGALSTLQGVDANGLLTALARRSRLAIAADLGGQQWGNVTHVARIAQVVDWLTAHGAATQVVLVGTSMGFAGAAAYTHAHPDKVKALAGILPCADLADVRTRGYAALVDAAYGGAYDDATDGPDHSPVKFAASLPPALPVHLWTSSDDPVCVPATAAAFIAARPATVRTNLGAYGHNIGALTAARDSLGAWVADQL